MTRVATNLYTNNLPSRYRVSYEVVNTKNGYGIIGSNGYATEYGSEFKTRNEVMKQLRELISEDKKDYQFEMEEKQADQ